MGTILMIAGWLTAAAAGEISVSSLARFAAGFRNREPAPEHEAPGLLPGVVAAAGVACLVLLGVAPVLPGALAAAALFTAGIWPLERYLLMDGDDRDAVIDWSLLPAAAYGTVLELLAQVPRALARIAEDFRAVTGLLRSRGSEAAAPGDAQGLMGARPRRMPSTYRLDPVLGPAPVPSQVAAELESAGVAVPGCWASVAEWIASFEPEDEDDWRNHIAENAAGILTVAEAIGGQAEDFAVGVKLDPAVVAAHTDFADDFAETSSSSARVLQAYDSVYEGINEHVASGGTIVENAREWHGAGDAGTEGGQAA
jgi:hypothetical protein